MFIGEAPGEEEDEKGEPFVGKAGGILDKRLKKIGVPREEVYVTNVAMCRPTKVVEGCLENRHPTKGEIKTCAVWLDEQVKLVSPKLIVPLGVRATSRVLGGDVVMEEKHGEIVPGQESAWEDPAITIIPTYHPTGARSRAQRQDFRADFEIIRDVYRSLRA